MFVAGATGYLGRHICTEYQRRGWHVTALVRDARRAGDLDVDSLVEAEATRPETLTGVMDGASVVVSSLGITRQADGLDYRSSGHSAWKPFGLARLAASGLRLSPREVREWGTTW